MAIFYTNSASFNSLQVTGSANITSTSGIALQLKSSGSTIFSISGSSGEIFNISDTTSTNLFSVGNGSTPVFSIDNVNATRITGSLLITGSVVVTGSVKVLNGITGSVFGTSSWAVNATTASLVNGNVNISTATIGNTTYATISTAAGAGTTSIYSVPNSTYSSIFVDYSINEGTTNARAGTIQVISVGSDISFTETTTMDIGNTNDISWDVYLTGADINFDIVNAAGASWTIKFSSRQM